jgi:hypothetical protein
MEDRTTDIKQYEAPRITDHGDLVELTAGQSYRTSLDVSLNVGFPASQANLHTTNP